MRQLQAKAGAALSSFPERPDHSERAGSPAANARAIVVLVCLAAVIYAADRWTKEWALANLEPGVPEPFVGNLLRLHLIFNPGAAFSLGTGLTPVFTVLQTVVAVAVLVVARRVVSTAWAATLGLLLGGVLGNLTDRLSRPPGFGVGHVVDFLQLPYWPIFNIADSSIVSSAVLVALLTARGTTWATARARPSVR